MLAAYLSALPLAIGTILATIPVLAVPLLLVTRPDRAPLHGFLAGWLAGFLALGAAAILFADLAFFSGLTSDLDLTLPRLILGVALLGFAVMKWRKRPLPGIDPETPGWMRRFDTISPGGAAAIGAALATLNPKNAVLAISGALVIAAATPAPAAQAGAFLLHSLTASIGLFAPLAAVLIGGKAAQAPLESLRAGVARHNATVMTVLLGVIGLFVIYGALA